MDITDESGDEHLNNHEGSDYRRNEPPLPDLWEHEHDNPNMRGRGALLDFIPSFPRNF